LFTHSGPVTFDKKNDMNTEAVYDHEEDFFDLAPGMTPDEQWELYLESEKRLKDERENN